MLNWNREVCTELKTQIQLKPVEKILTCYAYLFMKSEVLRRMKTFISIDWKKSAIAAVFGEYDSHSPVLLATPTARRFRGNVLLREAM